jgi:hypothetical protein
VTNLFFTVDSELLKFVDGNQTDTQALGISSIGHTAQVDWKLNDGAWQYTSDWDTQSGEYDINSGIYQDTGYLDMAIVDAVTILDLRNSDEGETPLQKKLGSAMIKGSNIGGDGNRLDLANNTFYFRVRLLVSYYAEATGESKFILSPWSETLSYGKGANGIPKPAMLEKPVISNPALGKNEDGSTYIIFTAITPKQVQDAYCYTLAHESSKGVGASIMVDHQININNTGWIDTFAGVGWLAGETRTIDVPETYDNNKVVKADEAYIQLRIRYTFEGGKTVGPLQSEWSNIITINAPGWSRASSWATKELQAADDAGLIPDILRGADMTKPITREEFAELAVPLYEKTSGVSAQPFSPNPFTDTVNPQVLKAFALHVTKGTSDTTFEPNKQITRQECATMLFRTIQAIAPNADYSVAGVPDFPDQKDIDGWASDGTKYMFKLGIIKGDSVGNFMPKSTTTAQQATGYGTATREAAILMSVRTYGSMK